MLKYASEDAAIEIIMGNYGPQCAYLFIQNIIFKKVCVVECK